MTDLLINELRWQCEQVKSLQDMLKRSEQTLEQLKRSCSDEVCRYVKDVYNVTFERADILVNDSSIIIKMISYGTKDINLVYKGYERSLADDFRISVIFIEMVPVVNMDELAESIFSVLMSRLVVYNN